MTGFRHGVPPGLDVSLLLTRDWRRLPLQLGQQASGFATPWRRLFLLGVQFRCLPLFIHGIHLAHVFARLIALFKVSFGRLPAFLELR